jgi:hypothetical protein
MSANSTFSGYATYWFAPEAKRIIKRVGQTTSSGVAFGQDWELVSYKLALTSGTPRPATIQAAAPSPAASTSDEVLTNEAVVAMVKAGLAEKLVVAKIHTTRGRFDLQSDALIQLKVAGVSDDGVLTATMSGRLRGGLRRRWSHQDPLFEHRHRSRALVLRSPA